MVIGLLQPTTPPSKPAAKPATRPATEPATKSLAMAEESDRPEKGEVTRTSSCVEGNRYSNQPYLTSAFSDENSSDDSSSSGSIGRVYLQSPLSRVLDTHRIDNAVGSSLADNSDSGSVSAMMGLPLSRELHPSRLVSTSLADSYSQSLDPSPFSADVESTSSSVLVHPPHPRYQYQYHAARGENGQRAFVPEYLSQSSSTLFCQNSSRLPMESSSSNLLDSNANQAQVANPFFPSPRDIHGYSGSSPERVVKRAVKTGHATRHSHDESHQVVDVASADEFNWPMANLGTRYGDQTFASMEAGPSTDQSNPHLHKVSTIDESVLERHRRDLEERGLMIGLSTPERARARVRQPTPFPFEVEELPSEREVSRRASVRGNVWQGLRRMPTEVEMVEFPTGGHVLAGVTPRLLRTERAHHALLNEQQEMTSMTIFWLCCVFPPLWLLYYQGCFDCYMRHVSHGAVKEMSAFYKNRALPLGVVYGLVTVVVITLIIYYISISTS